MNHYHNYFLIMSELVSVMKKMFSFLLLILFTVNGILSQWKRTLSNFPLGREKKSPCGKFTSRFSKGHGVHFVDNLKNQLLEGRGEVINYICGRSEIETCLRGGL